MIGLRCHVQMFKVYLWFGCVGAGLLRAQEQLEAMLEDILRGHRREQFA